MDMKSYARRPFTPADREFAFRRATSCFAAWFKEEIAAGMTDARLAETLAIGLGQGGSCGPDQPHEEHNGQGLRIWAGWTFPHPSRDQPMWSGAATLAYARQLYAVPNPDDLQLALF